VETIGDLPHVQNVHVVRQRVVDRQPEATRINGRSEPQVRDLVERVNARVGSTGSAQLDDVAARVGDGALQLSGDGTRVLLLLPPSVTGPFVFTIESVGGHEAGIIDYFAALRLQS
jgi:hypothetical protein